MKTISVDKYVDAAEEVILQLKKRVDKKGRPIQLVSASKLRNLLAMTADIYNDVLLSSDEKLSSEITSRIEYLRIRVIYECGRDESGRDGSVRDFIKEAKIIEILKEIGSSKADFLLFNRYMEALVAFHRFYGGKD